MNFEYLIDKISTADFSYTPFKHLYIEDFLDTDHFNAIVNCSEISMGEASSDEDLFERLFKNNYKVVSFPGCTSDYREYIRKHSRSEALGSHTACESAGVVLRLYPEEGILKALSEFIASKEFNAAIAEKFGVNFNNCEVDGGIQKYLDGYEISPHPDIRRKAATFMVNINPHQDSEKYNHHTHYLKFRDEYQYIRKFWEATPEADRQWVPWDWCDTSFLQTKNNSIVLFSPNNDTMHGVKANYDHLSSQRTQLYGNLWYSEDKCLYAPSWEKLAAKDFSNPNTKGHKIIGKLAKGVQGIVKKLTPKDPNMGDRGY
jgi:hypothetical protein